MASGNVFSVQCVEPNDDRWLNPASEFGDFYQMPAYAQVEAKRLGFRPFAVRIDTAGGGCLIPLLERPLGLVSREHRDAVSPYGYAGPLLWGALADVGLSPELVRSLAEVLSARGIIAVFLRCHPLQPRLGGAVPGILDVITRGPTIAIDLSLSHEDLAGRTRPSTRARIRKGLGAGLASRLTRNRSALPAFCEVYDQTMRRLNASAEYRFGLEYFERLLDLFPGMWLCLVEAEGACAAAGLFSEANGIVQFHLSGTSSDFLRLSPAALMLDSVRAWAKSRGNRWFHLGGGLGAKRDSLFEFKSGFGGELLAFVTANLVCNPTAYRAAVGEWRQSGGVEEGDFFPLYRKPILVQAK